MSACYENYLVAARWRDDGFAAGRKVRVDQRAPPSRAGTDVLAALLKAVQ
jgi:hypothetical protein